MCACGGSSHSLSQSRICSAPISVFVHVLLLSLCILLVQGPRAISCIPVSEFFPFGTDSDYTTERSDDGGSGRINLTVMFPFFGHRHDKLYVNNNGVISFFDELRTYRPEDFPLKDAIPIIAPYWADVDISVTNNGTVWYRESRDPLILSKASNEIKAFPAYKYFQAYWVFVATWDEVGFFGASGEGLNKKNTFQAVLVLDTSGRLSFVILNYAKIEWTTGSNSLGDTSTGLGGNPAQAGFNAGDKVNYFEIDGAGTSSVINLTQTSNMGVPGKWIFRIDSTEIQDVCSQAESGIVSFQPAFTSMLGGDPISVSDLCFDTKVPSVEGRLDTGYGASEELCCFIEDNSAKCFLPPMFLTGYVNISLNIGGRGWNYSGELEIKNIIDVTAAVIRQSPDEWVTGNRVSVFWKYSFLETASSYNIEILIFKIENGISSLHILSNTTYEKQDSGKYEMNLPKDFLGAKLAVVKVTAFPNNCSSSSLAGPSIYSDVFPVRYTDASYSQSACSSWLSQESKLKPLHVPGHCPCTLRQAEGDTAQYTQDPFCTRNSGLLSNCKYRSQAASQCIMPNQISEESGTFVCCYDKATGELLIALEGHGGGTMERYHFGQSGPSIVPYFTYMQEEISPYLHCCDFSKNHTLCEQYLRTRQPVGCQGYQPPAAAQAAGDPHIVTLDNRAYTFNGVGDFILLRVKNMQTTVQVRAVPVKNIKNHPQNATVFSAIVMKASNSSSTLEIRLRLHGEQELVSVYKDSELFTLSETTSQLSEMTVHANDSQNGTVELTVVMVDLGMSILVQATEEMLNIMVMAGSQLKGRLEGLLGNYNGDSTDDFIARDGTVLEVNATMREVHKFGMSWQVSQNDSLFKVIPVSEFDSNSHEQSDTSFYSPVFIDEMQDSELPNDTDRVCANNLQCRFDYRVTEKETIALSTLKFSQRYEERKQDVREVVRCPYFGADAVANGNRNLTGLQVGNIITVECNDGYSLNGSDKLTCKENGEWNTLPPACIRGPLGGIPQSTSQDVIIATTADNSESTTITIGTTAITVTTNGCILSVCTHLLDKVIPDESLPVTVAVGAAIGGFVLVVVVVLIIKMSHKKCSEQKFTKSIGSDIELPTLFPISDIPTPVFENSLFMSSLHKLSEKGSFQIPRPTFVDPNIYSEYF